MARTGLPERYRGAVTAAALAFVVGICLAYMGEVYIEDRFGHHATMWVTIAFLFGEFVLLGSLVLIFGYPLFSMQKPTEASIARVFWFGTLSGGAFFLDAAFEALIYPGFAFHDWTPQRFVSHALEMLAFGGVIIGASAKTRRKFLKKLRDGSDDWWS